MEFLSKDLNDYVEAHTSAESEVLKELARETHQKVLMPRMLSGHLQGRVLSMISKIFRPKNILELGTFTGYSSICLAEGLQEGGLLQSIDINEELREMVEKYIAKAGIIDSIKLHTGNALQIIPQLSEMFDLVFIDADKVNYSAYYDLLIDKVVPGGILIADNVLWSGKIIEEKPDKDTKALLAFNKKIQEDNRVENVLLPIRDGLLIIRKL